MINELINYLNKEFKQDVDIIDLLLNYNNKDFIGSGFLFNNSIVEYIELFYFENNIIKSTILSFKENIETMTKKTSLGDAVLYRKNGKIYATDNEITKVILKKSYIDIEKNFEIKEQFTFDPEIDFKPDIKNNDKQIKIVKDLNINSFFNKTNYKYEYYENTYSKLLKDIYGNSDIFPYMLLSNKFIIKYIMIDYTISIITILYDNYIELIYIKDILDDKSYDFEKIDYKLIKKISILNFNNKKYGRYNS